MGEATRRSTDSIVPDQINRAFGDMGAVMRVLGTKLEQPGAERWLHNTTPLDSPKQIGLFGAFSKVQSYPEGVALERWPSEVGALLASLDNGRIVTMGPTPASLEPIPAHFEAGTIGSHLLVIHNPDGSKPVIRYLDKEQLNGIVLLRDQSGLFLPPRQSRPSLSHGRSQKPGMHLAGVISEIEGYTN